MSIEAPEFYAPDSETWHNWLAEHHDSETKVWLVFDKKSAGGTLTVGDIIDEALCFGWIDSVSGKVDATRTKLYISRRKPKSVWSKINKEKIARLKAESRMQPAGLQAVAIAQANGSWNSIDAVENMVMPTDLATALAQHSTAKQYYEAFPKSSQKIILQWIASAKTPATRERRIQETVQLAGQNIRANHYRQPKGKG